MMNDDVNKSDGCTEGSSASQVNPNLPLRPLQTRELPAVATTTNLATDTADCAVVVSSPSSTIVAAASAVEEASSTSSCTDSTNTSNNTTTTGNSPLAQQQTINNDASSSSCCSCGSQDEESSSHTNDTHYQSQYSRLLVEPTAPLTEVTITTSCNSSDDSINEGDNNSNDNDGDQIIISNSSHRRMAKDPLGIGLPLPVLPPWPTAAAAATTTTTTTTTSSTATVTPNGSQNDDNDVGIIKVGVPLSIGEDVNDDNQLRHTRPRGDTLSTLTGYSVQSAGSNKSQEETAPAATAATAATATAQQNTDNVDSNNNINNDEPTPAESTPPIMLQRHVSMPGSYAIRGPGLPSATIRSRVSSSHVVGLSNNSGHSIATTTAYSYYDDADDDPYSDGTEQYPRDTTMTTTIRHIPSSVTLASMTSAFSVSAANNEQPSYLAEATLVTDDVSETDRDQQPQTQRQQQQERQGDEENQVIPSLVIHAEAKAISHRPRCLQAKYLLIGFCILLLTIVGMTIGFVIAFHNLSSNNNDNDNPQQVDTTASAAATATHNQNDTRFVPTLERLRQEGILRCGRSGELQRSVAYLHDIVETGGQNQTSLPQMFPTDIFRDYCAAIAAAALGNASAFELLETSKDNRYQLLANRSIDVLFTRLSMNMAQDVYEPSIGELYGDVGDGTGLAYSIPYQYSRTGFVGDPLYVDCADDILNQFRDCGGLMICVNKNMPFAEELQMLVPQHQLVVVDSPGLVVEDFMNGNCNLVAVETPDTMVAVLQALGYAGELKVGTTSLATGMMAVNTLDRDPKWADFVNAVMMALLAAEEAGLTQSTAADRIGQTELFGEDYKDMFIRAIEAREKFSETYNFVVTRKGRNSLNDGTSGLLASPPLDDIDSKPFHQYPRLLDGETLQNVKNRGFLNCGVNGGRPGFAAHNELSVWEGVDVDFCRALAASIFNGASYKATFFDVDISGSNGFATLQSNTIDVYAGAVWTLQDDIHETTTGEGYSFSQPYFYGPLNDTSFDENLCLATRQDDAKWSSFVYWTAQSLVYAEEHGIDQRESNQMPLVEVFGPEMQRMLRDAIHAVGNYREVYQRHLASLLPRGGRNMLNLVQDNLPLRYLPPGLPFRS